MAIKVYRIKVEEVVDRGAIQLIQGTTHLQTVNPSHSNERGVFIAQPLTDAKFDTLMGAIETAIDTSET